MKIHNDGTKEAFTAALFEAARRANPASTARYSMAHVEMVRDVDLPRLGALGVVAQTTPYWFASDLDYETEALGTDRASKLFRRGQIERQGGRLAFGSDFPATGDIAGLSPTSAVCERSWPSGHWASESSPPPIHRSTEPAASAGLDTR